jgi:hypothetical protein
MEIVAQNERRRFANFWEANKHQEKCPDDSPFIVHFPSGVLHAWMIGRHGTMMIATQQVDWNEVLFGLVAVMGVYIATVQFAANQNRLRIKGELAKEQKARVSAERKSGTLAKQKRDLARQLEAASRVVEAQVARIAAVKAELRSMNSQRDATTRQLLDARHRAAVYEAELQKSAEAVAARDAAIADADEARRLLLAHLQKLQRANGRLFAANEGLRTEVGQLFECLAGLLDASCATILQPEDVARAFPIDP